MSRFPAPPAPPASATPVALLENAPLALLRAACLRLHSRHASCEACATACPAGVLRVQSQSLTLDEGCSGCGRCQAACPMGALSASGFDTLRHRPAARYRAVTIDCARVPDGAPAAALLRVPCLGGISLGTLLELTAADKPAAVQLLDRGWCAGCANGGSRNPAADLVERAAMYLAEAGLPPPYQPQIVARPLAPELAQPVGGAAAGTRRRRRAFLHLAARSAAAVAHRRPVATIPERQAAPSVHASRERRRILAALERVAVRHGGQESRRLFHAIVVNDLCSGHRVCAAACPTGALRRYRDDAAGMVGLAHDARDCVGCGHCEAICPEGALRLERGAGTTAGRTVLTAFAQRACRECGERFVCRDQSEMRCERCRKSAALAGSAFRQLFGGGPRVA